MKENPTQSQNIPRKSIGQALSKLAASSTTVRQLADHLLAYLGETLEYRKATLQLVYRDERNLVAYRGFQEDGIDAWLLRPISQDPLITRTFALAAPLILSQPQEDPDWKPRPQTANVNSWVGIPLIYGNQPVGLITLDHDRPAYYNETQREFLQLFAFHAAAVLENKRLVEFNKRREQDLQFLNEIATVINAQLDTQSLLNTLVTQITQKLQCSHCAIFFPREENGQTLLYPAVVEEKHATQIGRRRFKPGEGIAGWVFEHGQSELLPDARLDARFSPPQADEDLPRSLLVVPIQAGGRTIGVISADHTICDWFTSHDRILVDALAKQAGIAIQRNRGFELLQEIGAQINSARDVREIMQFIVQGAIELIHTTSGVIYQVSEEGTSIKAGYIYPPNSLHPAPRMDDPQGSTRTIIATGKWLQFVDVEQNPRVNPQLKGQIKSMLAVPLKHGQKVIGVLYLNDKNRHEFTTTEVSLLQTLGNQAATAIYHADLLRNLEIQVDRHRVLNQVGAQLTGLQDESLILDAVSNAAKETLMASHCSVFQLQGDSIIVRAAHGSLAHDVQPGRAFKVGQGIAGWVAQNGQSVLVADTDQDARFDPSWSSPPPRSIVASPILLEKRVYGVISAEHTEPGQFTQLDQQLIETLAFQASQAIRSAHRIYALQSLNHIVRQISQEMEIDNLFETLLDNVNTTLGCLYSAVFIQEPSGGLEEVARRGCNGVTLPRRSFEKDEGLAGYAVSVRKTLNIPDVEQDQHYIDSRVLVKGQPHSMLLVPMIRQDQVVGLISADKDIIDGFSESDEKLLETLASQAAISYENARLFKELGLLQDISNRLLTLDQDQLLGQIVQGAVELTQTEYGVIYLLSDDGARIVASVGYPGSRGDPEYPVLSYEGITRLIFRTGETLYVGDTHQDPRVSEQVRREWRSFIGYPIKTNNHVIGVLYLNDTDIRTFSPSEQKLVGSLVWQAAAAIENARLFIQRDQSTSALRGIIEILGTIGMDEDPLPTILREISRVLPKVYFGFLALKASRGRRHEIRSIYADGAVKTGTEIPYSQRDQILRRGEIKEIIAGGSPYRSGDIREDPAFSPWKSDTRSALMVPIKDRAGRAIGVLGLESRERDLFGLSEQSLCQDLANIAAIAYEKSQLYEDLQRQARFLSALRDVSNRLTELPDRQDILDTVVRMAQETLEAARCTLFVINEDSVLTPQAITGVPLEQVASIRFPIGKGLAGWVAKEEQSLLVPDAHEDDRFIEDELAAGDLTRRMVLTPLWLEGKVIGVMSADRDGGQEFDDVDRHFFETLAVQAGIFIRQEHLRRQRVEAIRKRFNPYTVGAPIANPGGFFGRRKIIREIIDGIHNNHYIIFGERRIGKTSLLMQLENQLKTLSGQDAIYQYLPIFASLQALPAEDRLFAYLIEKILTATLIIPDDLYYGPDQAVYTHKEMEEDLELILEYLQEQFPGKSIRIVLLLDEMDIFSAYGYDTHRYFRSLLMSRPGTHLQLVMAGVSIHFDANLPTSPWYNLFTSYQLKPFEAATARQLVVDQVAGYYTYDEAALEFLLACSDFKPMELQRLASLSVTAMLDRIHPELENIREESRLIDPCITRPDVDLAIRTAVDQKGKEYQNIWESLAPSQKNFILAAARGDGFLSPQAREHLGDFISARKALFNPILTFVDEQPRLTYLFMRWLEGGVHEESL